MKHFKNEERKTLEQCSDEEKLCIVKRLCEKGFIEYLTFPNKTWHRSDYLYRDNIYRVPPKETKVFWDRLAKDVVGYVRNESSEEYLLTELPEISNSGMRLYSSGSTAKIPHILSGAIRELGDEELPLLIERPEE